MRWSMKSYNLTEQDLLDLCQKSYDAGYQSYMDLKDSICESIVANFVDEKKYKCENKIFNQIYGASDFAFAGSSNYSGSTYFITSSMIDSSSS